jgi:hypothetical protein
MSSAYTFQGTPQPSRGILSAVIAGDSVLVNTLLKKFPSTETIGWLWEPYAILYSTSQFEALTLVMDDPRFRFDARFVSGCCYFTPHSLRKLVLRHPRARGWVVKPETFETDYIRECSAGSIRYSQGLHDRMYYAKNDIYSANRLYQKTQRKRLAFILYPFLKSWITCFLAEYYRPGGKAFLKAKERFETRLLTL